MQGQKEGGKRKHLWPLHILGVRHDNVGHVILIAAALGVARAALQAGLGDAQAAALPRLKRARLRGGAPAAALRGSDLLLRPLAMTRYLNMHFCISHCNAASQTGDGPLSNTALKLPAPKLTLKLHMVHLF